MGRSYFKITEVTDYGPFITKLVLPMPEPVKAEAVRPESFSVYVERKDEKGNILELPKTWMAKDDKEPSKGYCVVKAAYPSCRCGSRKEEGDYVTLEMKYGPIDKLSAAISAPNGFNEYVISDYRIMQTQEIVTENGKVTGMVFDLCGGDTCRQTEKFLLDVSSHPELPLKYGYFVPQAGNGKRPLIIWLHGAGEGGQDPRIAFSGNKVVNLASEEIQDKFGGAFVLTPQTPTFWMDDGSGEYGHSGKSIYTGALKYLIDEFVSHNEAAVDTNRIYIGGCSNGGFMTMRMVLDYPDFFASAFPVCEALYDEVITDAQIEAVKHLPVWFTHSKDDFVVKPEETVLATYRRLKGAGASNVHFSFFDKVVDIHGLFQDEKGEPFTYMGHFSWIYMLNDDCRLDFDGNPVTADGREVTLLDWLALQTK